MGSDAPVVRAYRGRQQSDDGLRVVDMPQTNTPVTATAQEQLGTKRGPHDFVDRTLDGGESERLNVNPLDNMIPNYLNI